MSYDRLKSWPWTNTRHPTYRRLMFPTFTTPKWRHKGWHQLCPSHTGQIYISSRLTRRQLNSVVLDIQKAKWKGQKIHKGLRGRPKHQWGREDLEIKRPRDVNPFLLDAYVRTSVNMYLCWIYASNIAPYETWELLSRFSFNYLSKALC